MMKLDFKTRFLLGMALLLALLIPNPCSAESSFSATVTGILRGDALELERGEKRPRVFLYGVECPSSLSDTGKQAKAFTRGLVLDVSVEVDVVTEIQDLVYVQIRLPDGTLLNHRLIEAGFASWDRISAPRAPELEALERQARERGVGMWSDPDAPVVDANSPAALSDTLARFKERRAVLRRIEFEMAFIHWRDFSDAERVRIRADLERTATEYDATDHARGEGQAEVLDALAAERQDLENQYSAVTSRLDEFDLDEEEEIARLYDDPDLDLEREYLELMGTDRASAEKAGVRTIDDFIEYYYRNEEARKRMAERDDEMDAQAQEIRAEYAARRSAERERAVDIQAQEEQVYQDQLEVENRAQRVRAMARKRAMRNSTQIAEIDALEGARLEEYALESRPHTIVEWEGNKSRIMGPFRVKTPMWAIDWNTFSHAGARNVSMDIFRSEDDQLVVRVSNTTLPYKSFKILESPGIYYIEIKTREAIPYHIQIIEFR